MACHWPTRLFGNTSDKATLRDLLQRIEAHYGKAGRTLVMDRGIPTEAVLAEMRAAGNPHASFGGQHHAGGSAKWRNREDGFGEGVGSCGMKRH